MNDDRMSALELRIKEESEERKKRCETMAGYSNTIEGTLDCLLASTNEINRKLNMSEESNRSLVRDAITKHSISLRQASSRKRKWANPCLSLCLWRKQLRLQFDGNCERVGSAIRGRRPVVQNQQ